MGNERTVDVERSGPDAMNWMRRDECSGRRSGLDAAKDASNRIERNG
jgi:hypothetical protein